MEALQEIASDLCKAQGSNDRFAEAQILRRYAEVAMPSHRSKTRYADIITRLLRSALIGSSDCWVFIGRLNACGYGCFSAKREGFKSIQLVHRVSWRVFRGDIPDGMCVLHKCDVRSCFNPEHLFLGTHRENMQDMGNKNRHPNKRLSFEDVTAMRGEYLTGSSLDSLAEKYLISKGTACAIVNNKRRVKQ